MSELGRERLVMLGTLAASVAHELNGPLASAITLLELALEKLPKDAVAQDLAFAVRQLERAKALAQSVLHAARQDGAHDEPVVLARAAADAVRLVTTREKERKVELIAPELPPIQASSAAIVQLVVNLVTNAVQAARSRVRVEIAGADGGQVIRVEDDGPGVAPEVRARAGEPFVTTKPAGEGVGLGLWICHAIARDHGGRLDLGDSSLGGASFTFFLPERP